MQKLYMDYPEISKIKANIISRRYLDDKTQIILDRTIFMPNSKEFLADKGRISAMEVLNVEEKKDNIIHTIQGKPQKSEVFLDLDMTNRRINLSYNTAYIIFKLIFDSFYRSSSINLIRKEEDFFIEVNDFYDVFDEKLILDQINFLIGANLKIESKQGITKIDPIGDVINNFICFDNTGKIRGLVFENIDVSKSSLKIKIKACDDILKWWFNDIIFNFI